MQVKILITTALSVEAFDLRKRDGGMLYLPAAWTAANIGFKGAYDVDGTYFIIRDPATNIPIQLASIVADRAYPLLPLLNGAWWVKLWSKSATAATETDVNQAAERVFEVTLD